MREKFRNGADNVLLSSYWVNLYYTLSDPGIITQDYLICPHQNLKPNLSLSQFTSVSAQQYAEARFNYRSDRKEIKEISSCQDCLLKSSALVLRAEMEIELFNELNCIQPFEGPWFIISISWINQWKKYCALSYTENNDCLDPVNNKNLFDDNDLIKAGLQAGKDYRGVNRHVWAGFMYLYKGGPEIARVEADIYSQPAQEVNCSSPDITQEILSKLKAIQSTYPNN